MRFTGYLGRARIPLQVDVSFGDALVPAPEEVQLQPILDLPSALLLGYIREEV